MAIVGSGGRARDIRALARRIFERLREYPRKHGGGVPINDTLSRIFEHEPAYQPLRRRSEKKGRPPIRNPGIFTVQRVADALKTTVGDLLGEPGYVAARDLLSTNDRRKLRQAILILRKLFDLDDESLDEVNEPVVDSAYRFVVPPHEFIERDHDYPRTLHAWVVPDVPAAAGPAGIDIGFELTTTQVLHSIREIWDARLQVVRIVGDSMSPVLESGWKVLVDTQKTKPIEGALVAVYIKDEGGVIGRWHCEGNQILLLKSNPDARSVHLGRAGEWTLWGTVTQIVEAPAI